MLIQKIQQFVQFLVWQFMSFVKGIREKVAADWCLEVLPKIGELFYFNYNTNILVI
jgi:hypothetical protein